MDKQKITVGIASDCIYLDTEEHHFMIELGDPDEAGDQLASFFRHHDFDVSMEECY